jgi:hypothetical protein
LTQDELQNIINELEEHVSKDNATFGIFQYGGNSDESYIQADKEGLKLFALELLKAAGKTDEIINDKVKNIIPFPLQESWIDEKSDTVIQYVEPINKRPLSIDRKRYKSSIVNKLMPYGCSVGLLIILIAIILGLWTLIKWIF